MNLASLFLLIAVILFVVGALGANMGRVNIVSLGLAFLAGAFLVESGML